MRGMCYRLPALSKAARFHALAGCWSVLLLYSVETANEVCRRPGEVKDDDVSSIESNPHDFSLQPCAISALGCVPAPRETSATRSSAFG